MANVAEQTGETMGERTPQNDIIHEDMERPMNGVLITKQKYDWCKERSALGILSLRQEAIPVGQEVFVDKSFCSREDENAFISCCNLGPEFIKIIDNFSPQPKLPKTGTHGEYYRSKLRHTWIVVTKYTHINTKSYKLTPQALQSLYELRNTMENKPNNIEKNCISFLERFGSHISKGPILFGGRLVKKVSCAEMKDGFSVEEVDKTINETFEKFVGEDRSEFEGTQDNDELVIQIEKLMLGYPPPEPFSDCIEWKAKVADGETETSVISCTFEDEKLISVWEFIRRNNLTFGVHTNKLAQAMFESWKKLSGFQHLRDIFWCEDDDKEDEMYLPSNVEHSFQNNAELHNSAGIRGQCSSINNVPIAEPDASNDEFQECFEDGPGYAEQNLSKTKVEGFIELNRSFRKEEREITTTAKLTPANKGRCHVQNDPYILQDLNQQLPDYKLREKKKNESRLLLEQLGLFHYYPCKAKSQNVMAIRKPLKDADVDNGFAKAVLQDIMSLDFRGRKGYNVERQDNTVVPVEKTLPKGYAKDIFAAFQKSSNIKIEHKIASISALDVMHSIFHCCNPFLLQDLLCKMTDCQLAIPILLPYFDQNKVSLLLWGHRKIRKKWRSPLFNEILEKTAVSFSIPLVTFVRLGSPTFSKTKLLNKLIGPYQGNNEHPYFIDQEHDIGYPNWSKGTVEIVWYMPEGGEGSNEILKDAIGFMNLRGDALKFPTQLAFVSKFSDITVAILDEGSSLQEEALKIASNNRKLIVVVNSHISSSETKKETLTQDNITIIDGSGQSVINLCKELCSSINSALVGIQPQSIEDIAKYCAEIGIEVDEYAHECVLARKRARTVLASTYAQEGFKKQTPAEYKQQILPLQTTFWKKWAHLDKKSEKVIQAAGKKSIEHVKDEIARDKRTERELQAQQKVSFEVTELIQALQSREINLRKYFLASFQFRLNDMSRESLGPLIKELRSVQNERRKFSGLMKELDESVKKENDTLKKNQIIEHMNIINQKEQDSLRKIKYITKQFDDNSLGPEHFMREVGQIFEAYVETKETNADVNFDMNTLPQLAAEMLIDGHPIEILDGDIGHVPIKWVNAVLESVTEKLNNPTIYVISVIGIQSSGKSTLLNNMFGLSFAVSAGRCTRGVFIQMVPVLQQHRWNVGCDFVVVVDTEGLKAPERALMEGHHHDNELATFALCLSDLTLINISGQTVGEDMTDILQIAAHAFIRMKEVQLKSSCRIVQQFVSDLSAVDRNETGTQSILVKLDEATAKAAEEEDLSHRYQRFSDVFNLELDENLQYIPNLYGGSMSPPNHRYSETVRRLKNAIVKDIKGSARPMSFFRARINDVWAAVKEEEFIFSFQSSMEALQYKEFQFVYGKWVSEIRQKVLE